MKQQRITRTLGALGAAVLLCALCAEVWWFFGFTRFYFPTSPLSQLALSTVPWMLGLAYFASVALTARWAPWARTP
jgi:hypothetical protein